VSNNQSAPRIAIASGKGGTGKTTVATSLALSLANNVNTGPPLYLDCDAEAPDAHLFLNPDLSIHQPVNILIPSVDSEGCTYCGVCADICQYHAIAVLGKNTLVFPQLCHGCGSCTALCPENAISEHPRPVGEIERGRANSDIDYARGLLHIGEPMAVPIIRQLKSWAKPNPGQITILDAPPGTSCPVVETVREADFLLLVTEPTPFGLHDLQLAVEIANELHIPAGVVINRDGTSYDKVESFCKKQNLPVMMRIPFERAIAVGLASGKTLIEIQPQMESQFEALFKDIVNRINNYA
jgi:MinD superfamily P-loop ATPase